MDRGEADRLDALARRVDVIEHNLRTALARLQVPWTEPTGYPPGTPAELAAALDRRDKVTAAKLYREWQGVGLAEAAAAVDRLIG